MQQISELMTRSPAVCTPETNLEQVVKAMIKYNCGQIPVVNNLKEMVPVGVVTDRDIACRSIGRGKDPFKMVARDCMSGPVTTIRFDEPIEEALKVMVFKKIRRLPVLDGSGKICGVLSQADVAGRVDNSLVGEVLSLLSQPTESPAHHAH